MGIFRDAANERMQEIAQTAEVDPAEVDIEEVLEVGSNLSPSGRSGPIPLGQPVYVLELIAEDRPARLVEYVPDILDFMQNELGGTHTKYQEDIIEILSVVASSHPNEMKPVAPDIAEVTKEFSKTPIWDRIGLHEQYVPDLCDILGTIGSPEAIPVLQSLENHDNEAIRTAASKAIQEIEESQHPHSKSTTEQASPPAPQTENQNAKSTTSQSGQGQNGFVGDEKGSMSTESIPASRWKLTVMLCTIGWVALLLWFESLSAIFSVFLLFSLWVGFPIAIYLDSRELEEHVEWPNHRWIYILGSCIWFLNILVGLLYLHRRPQMKPEVSAEKPQASSD